MNGSSHDGSFRFGRFCDRPAGALPLLALLVVWSPIAPAAQLELTIGRAELAALPLALREIHLACTSLAVIDQALACTGGDASVRVEGWGVLRGALALRYESGQRWSAHIGPLAIGDGRVDLTLQQSPRSLLVRAEMHALPAARVLPLLVQAGVPMPLTGTGAVSGPVEAVQVGESWQLRYALTATGLTLNEPSGRYASEGLTLALQGTARLAGDSVEAALDLEASAGQAYVEPIFADFGALPLTSHVELRWRAPVLRITQASWQHRGVMRGRAQATLAMDAQPPLRDATIEIEQAQLPAFAATWLQPWVAGTRLEGVTGTGTLSARARVAGGVPQRMEVDAADVTLAVPRLDSELAGMSGHLAWDADTLAPSSLAWSGGRAQRVPLGASQIDFALRGRDVQLLSPWTQPILDGALEVQRLSLRALGAPAFAADFAAEIRPIDLAALSQALDWPRFTGKLSGRLPGLTVREGNIAVDGKLEAQAFDGEITVAGLALTDPFGVLPRLSADVRLRNLDLEQLTGAFSFGRIEGRLDGDVTGLRLLGWKPVAFAAKLYTPPGDDSRHRISQRAIDSISSIGGGPRGLLSRGLLSVFKDFAYERIGWSCVLDNGICTMDGIEPRADGYLLVKGKWLPRIDVVGYARRVRFAALLEQIRAARTAEISTTPPK